MQVAQYRREVVLLTGCSAQPTGSEDVGVEGAEARGRYDQ